MMLQPTTDIEFPLALARLGGNREILCDLARFYLEDYQGLLEGLESNWNSRRLAEVERLAHSLKGLAVNFDAETLVSKCFEIEVGARGGTLSEISDEMTKIRLEANHLAERLRRLIESFPDDNA